MEQENDAFSNSFNEENQLDDYAADFWNENHN